MIFCCSCTCWFNGKL